MRRHGLSDQSCLLFSNSIPATLRAELLNDETLSCHKCGIGAGEVDTATGIRARLQIDALELSANGNTAAPELQVICSICQQGAKHITTPRPTTIWLLSQVRRAGQEEQRAVLKWLRQKFKE
jgi:hypothetical protein